MKRLFAILFIVLAASTTLTTKCFSQDEVARFVLDDLKTFHKDLSRLGTQLDNDTTLEVDKYEIELKARQKMFESWYQRNSEIILSEKDLQSKYIEYTTLNDLIQKTVDDRKAAKNSIERKEKLSAKLKTYQQTMLDIETEANTYVEHKSSDSLKMAKDKAMDAYSMVTMEYGKNQEFIDDDEELSALFANIKTANSRIARLEVAQNSLNMTTILMILGIIAALALVASIVINTVKSLNLNKKPKQPKKKNEDLPSI